MHLNHRPIHDHHPSPPLCHFLSFSLSHQPHLKVHKFGLQGRTPKAHQSKEDCEHLHSLATGDPEAPPGVRPRRSCVAIAIGRVVRPTGARWAWRAVTIQGPVRDIAPAPCGQQAPGRLVKELVFRILIHSQIIEPLGETGGRGSEFHDGASMTRVRPVHALHQHECQHCQHQHQGRRADLHSSHHHSSPRTTNALPLPRLGRGADLNPLIRHTTRSNQPTATTTTTNPATQTTYVHTPPQPSAVWKSHKTPRRHVTGCLAHGPRVETSCKRRRRLVGNNGTEYGEVRVAGWQWRRARAWCCIFSKWKTRGQLANPW